MKYIFEKYICLSLRLSYYSCLLLDLVSIDYVWLISKGTSFLNKRKISIADNIYRFVKLIDKHQNAESSCFYDWLNLLLLLMFLIAFYSFWISYIISFLAYFVTLIIISVASATFQSLPALPSFLIFPHFWISANNYSFPFSILKKLSIYLFLCPLNLFLSSTHFFI